MKSFENIAQKGGKMKDLCISEFNDKISTFPIIIRLKKILPSVLCHSIIILGKSQIYRRFESGRDLWISPSWNHLLKPGSDWSGLWVSPKIRNHRLCNHSRKPVALFGHSHIRRNNKTNNLVGIFRVSVCALHLLSSYWHHCEESHWAPLLHHHELPMPPSVAAQCLFTWMRFPRVFFSRLTGPLLTCCILWAFCHPLLDWLHSVHMSCTGKPRLDPELWVFVVVSRAEGSPTLTAAPPEAAQKVPPAADFQSTGEIHWMFRSHVWKSPLKCDLLSPYFAQTHE